MYSMVVRGHNLSTMIDSSFADRSQSTLQASRVKQVGGCRISECFVGSATLLPPGGNLDRTCVAPPRCKKTGAKCSLIRIVSLGSGNHPSNNNLLPGLPHVNIHKIEVPQSHQNACPPASTSPLITRNHGG